MKKYVLNIKENGYILCTIENEDGKIKYIKFNEIKDLIMKNHNGGILLRDNNLQVKNQEYEIIINNIHFNKDKDLGLLIIKLIEEYKKSKKLSLKNKKVKRVKFATLTIVIALSISIGLSYIANIINKIVEDYKEHMEEKDVAVVTDVVKASTLIQDTPLEPLDFEDYLDANNATRIEISHTFENNTDTKRFQNCKENYYDLIKKISWEYGIDPRIMLAIATKESGKHFIDEKANDVGLMQINSNTWNDKVITAYNYNTKQEESINVTREKLYDLEFNIRVGCMCMQQCLKYSKYDLKIAIQMYNYGIGNISKIFKSAYNNPDFSIPRDLGKHDDEWLNYRNLVKKGNPVYLEDILSYIEDTNSLVCYNKEEIIVFNVKNNNMVYKH